MTTLTIAMAVHAFTVHAAPTSPQSIAADGSARFTTVPEDNAKWRREPFIGADSKKTKPAAPITTAGKKSATESSDSTEVNLQGIMQADKSFHALIDGRAFKVGDKIGRLTIFEISRYRVVVQDHNKEKTIYDIHKGKINRGEK
jgi:hypothetical protein